MKKRVIALLCGVCLAIVPVGCGSTDTSTEATADETAETAESTEDTAEEATADEADDTPVVDDDSLTWEDCVTLGNLVGLELTKTVTEVTDDDIESNIEGNMAAEEVDDADATVADGDTVDIDYVGKQDGVEFEGGSAENYELVIGSDTFIDGFEDGLIGMKAGETKDLNLTFPDDYSSEDLAGQDVVFTVTVNAIKRVPELTDEWVKEYTDGECNTVDEYREQVRQTLEEENAQTDDYNLQSTAWAKVMEDATFSQLPKSMVEEASEAFKSSLEEQAEAYGYEFEDFISMYGYDEDSFNDYLEDYGKSQAKATLLLDALCDALDVTEDSDLYQQGLQTLLDMYDMDEDTLRSSYSEDEVEKAIMSAACIDAIIDQAKITETAASTDDSIATN